MQPTMNDAYWIKNKDQLYHSWLNSAYAYVRGIKQKIDSDPDASEFTISRLYSAMDHINRAIIAHEEEMNDGE